jgi:L-arabinose transport system permease protein
MAIVLAALLILCWIWVPNFRKWDNATNLLHSVSIVGTIACTMLFCLAAGDFDLSIGGTVALGGVLAAQIINSTHNAILGIAIPIAAGALIGLVNGFVIARIGINALITTLATMQIVRGVGFLRTNGASIPCSEPQLLQFAGWQFLGLQAEVWYMIAAFIVFGLLLNRTVFGRNTLAIGGNKEAARLAGINVVRTKVAIFVLQGIVAAIAGVFLASRTFSGAPNTQQGLELRVISSCVLGGVSLTGGVGSISGVIIGVLIMGIVQNAMQNLRIDEFWQLVASGIVLLAAVMLDRLKARDKT